MSEKLKVFLCPFVLFISAFLCIGYAMPAQAEAAKQQEIAVKMTEQALGIPMNNNVQQELNGSSFEIVTPIPKVAVYPDGDYILVIEIPDGGPGANTFGADLYLDDTEICHWDLGVVRPEDRSEWLYFTKDLSSPQFNCPNLPQNVYVAWDTQEQKGFLWEDGENTSYLEVFYQPGGGEYHKLTKQ